MLTFQLSRMKFEYSVVSYISLNWTSGNQVRVSYFIKGKNAVMLIASRRNTSKLVLLQWSSLLTTTVPFLVERTDVAEVWECKKSCSSYLAEFLLDLINLYKLQELTGSFKLVVLWTFSYWIISNFTYYRSLLVVLNWYYSELFFTGFYQILHATGAHW